MPPKDKPFLNKVIWITGASSGIGEQLSYTLADLGATLILSARNTHHLKRVKDKLPENTSAHEILPLDLEQIETLPGSVKTALSYYGTIDYFISNAGVAIRDYAIATELHIDQKLMNINYFGPMVITKKLLPHFINKNNGHIVVISSLSGKYGIPRVAAYAASKHALHGFFETLRSETHEKGIFITMIIPGIIKTNITAHALKGNGEPFGIVEKTFLTGYPVEKAADKIIKAIINKKEELFVGGSERITLWLNKVSPWLLRRFIRNHPIKKMRKFKRYFRFSKNEKK
jgi:short-subunit dehydrogenase